MADSELQDLTEDTAPAAGDVVYVVVDPSGTPLSRRMTVQNLMKALNLLTTDTTMASGDFLMFYDADAATADKISPLDFLEALEDFGTAITSGYASGDTVMVIDGGVAKFSTLTNLFAGVEDFTSELTTRPATSDTFLVVDGGVAKFITSRNLQIRYVQLVVTDFTTDCATGDGQFYWHCPANMAGLDMVEVHGEVISTGTTNTMDIQLRNVTQAGASILSTKLTLDSGESGSDTAATPAVIDTGQDDLQENDVIAVDIDAIHTTAAKGLIVTMGFS